MEHHEARILVVDDDRRIRELLKFKLWRLGYQVMTAGDEHQFLKQAFLTHPDLIILDIWLGNRWGTKLYDTLLTLGFDPQTPVVFITGLAGREEPIHCDSYALFTKPIHFKELAEDIERLISSRHAPSLN